MTKRLEGLVALVTGAASGIGEHTARQFAAEGAKVVLADINIERGRLIANEIGGNFIATNVSDERQVQAAVEFAVQNHGRLDCMVNNAGMIGVVGSILETDAKDWHATHAVLLDSVFYGIKHAGRQMRQQKSGVILSISSLAGVTGGVGPQVYSVAKAGVIALTKGAASELAQYGIRVNAVAPGLVVTPLVGQVYGDTEKAVEGAKSASPLGSAALPEEIAATLVYLASNEARHITAHTVVVDSGVSVAGSAAASMFHNKPAGFLGRMPETQTS